MIATCTIPADNRQGKENPSTRDESCSGLALELVGILTETIHVLDNLDGRDAVARDEQDAQQSSMGTVGKLHDQLCHAIVQANDIHKRVCVLDEAISA